MLFWVVYTKKDIEVNRISKFIYDHTGLGFIGAVIVFFLAVYIFGQVDMGFQTSLILFAILIGTLYYVLMGSVKGCQRCHQFFGRKRLSREILGTSHHTRTSQRIVHHYDSQGKITGSSSFPVSELKTEHHVKNEWECKKCGYTWETEAFVER